LHYITHLVIIETTKEDIEMDELKQKIAKILADEREELEYQIDFALAHERSADYLKAYLVELETIEEKLGGLLK